MFRNNGLFEGAITLSLKPQLNPEPQRLSSSRFHIFRIELSELSRSLFDSLGQVVVRIQHSAQATMAARSIVGKVALIGPQYPHMTFLLFGEFGAYSIAFPQVRAGKNLVYSLALIVVLPTSHGKEGFLCRPQTRQT